jgi:hypothetical protein
MVAFISHDVTDAVNTNTGISQKYLSRTVQKERKNGITSFYGTPERFWPISREELAMILKEDGNCALVET